MKETILDIREKLLGQFYINEEHIRFSLVSRVLSKLGWDIWNPKEVFTEFKAVPNEDLTRVDIALFINEYQPPSIFIEIKSIGKVDIELERIEQQLRDYNRNNTAEFSIITDGQKWRFYYSQSGGEFAQKCFKTIDLLSNEVEDSVNIFTDFLFVDNIKKGNSRFQAQRLLQLNQKQRAMQDALPKAKRMISEPPFPSLPEAIVNLVKQVGFEISFKDASNFAEQNLSGLTDANNSRSIANKEITMISKSFHPVNQIKKNKKTNKPKNFPPDGTKCRFNYKGRLFTGVIQGNEMHVVDFGNFTSFSSASGKISKTSRNGWTDWELLLPNAIDWVLADQWRSNDYRIE